MGSFEIDAPLASNYFISETKEADMPKCNDCGNDFGIFELSKGTCKGCSTFLTCSVCDQEFKASKITMGMCAPCMEKERAREKAEQLKKNEELENQNAAKQAELEKKKEELENMPLSTVLEIPGRRTKRFVALVRGGTVRSKHLGSDMLAGIKSSTVGGEIVGYTKLMANAREEAIFRLKEDAVRVGANAVVGVNFASASLVDGMSEIYAFGTGIELEEAE